MLHTFLILVIIIVLTSLDNVNSDNYSYIDLPANHLPFYFNNFKQLAEKCKNDSQCGYQKILMDPEYKKNSCWGYEPSCKEENYYSVPHCFGDHIGYVPTKEAQIQTFFAQGNSQVSKLFCDNMSFTL
jgi:EGF domain-specific O-GlcNAc transferase